MFIYKKQVILIALSFLFLTHGFCHKAQKQSELIEAEFLTEKWLECESAAFCSSSYTFQKKLENFYDAVKKAVPSDTVVYYFPDAHDVYKKICFSLDELLMLVKNEPLDFKEYDRLCHEMNKNLCDWEILQKNIAQFQLKRVNYSYRILIAIIIVLILISLVFFLMYVAISKNRDENELFTSQMLKAQEAERERISNELHDTVCQDLRVLQFQIDDEESVNLCKKIAGDVRNTCYALTPSDLSEGILEALISLCSMTKQTVEQNIILSIQDDIKNNPAIKVFPKDKNLDIYRIVQEIINNAINHSESETISVLVRSCDSTRFKIIVSDDGKGFDLKAALRKKNHFGLKNIYRRAQSIHGEISIKTAPDEGTQTTVIIPYK